MRLRNVKHAREKILKHPEYILAIGRSERYLLNNAFKDQKPLVLEIGAGKGQFSHQLAKKHPEWNVLAVEKFDNVIVRALEKVIVEPLNNLYLVRMDAEQLQACLHKNSVDKIYLNFSDPWPKARHEKRRLTHADFLDIYKSLLKPNGQIEFKTDNRGLFEFSLISMNQYGLLFDDISLDLHKDDVSDNIQTEFEERFSKQGPIYKITATFKEDNDETNLR